MQQPAARPTADRYARQRILPGFGDPAQTALETARVLVIGAGGLGSSVIPALAAAGVGTIGIVDDDTVEASNLHRQLIHGVADVGDTKVASAARSVEALNPAVVVERHGARLTSRNALDLFARYDLVLDGSDNFVTRYLANDAAALTGIPLVWGAVSQYGGQAGVAWAARGPHYRDLFPTPPPPGTVLSCAVGGVLPTVCAVIGSIMATEAIKILTGVGTPLVGAVTTFDALTGSFRELTYASDPDAEPIHGLIDYEAFCGVPKVEQVTTITAAELAAGDAPAVLLDVRETWEAGIARLDHSVLIPLGDLGARLGELDPDAPTIVYCHHGMRSATALGILEAAGFTDARHLEGGIDAWSRTVDPAIPRY